MPTLNIFCQHVAGGIVAKQTCPGTHRLAQQSSPLWQLEVNGSERKVFLTQREKDKIVHLNLLKTIINIHVNMNLREILIWLRLSSSQL